MFCTKCGHQVSDYATFCERCGTRLAYPSQLTKTEVQSRKPILTPENIQMMWGNSVSYINICSKSERKKRNAYVVIDFETTGLDMYTNEIIEYAAVKVENGNIGDRIQSLCKPYYPIPTVATRINGITNQMVSDKPYFVDRLEYLLDFIDGNIIVAHNASFDIGFLNKYCTIMNKPLVTKCSCTMRMARSILAGTIDSFRLISVANYLGVQNNEYHRALGDTLTTAKVLVELIRMRSAMDTPVQNSIGVNSNL